MRTKDIIKEEANRGGGETSLNTKIEAKQDQIKFKKLEMPVIDSEDQESWFYREKHFFFQLHLLNEQEKLAITIVSMEGKGLSWFH